MSSTPGPDGQRPPLLSEADLHRALDELDAKIRTLHNRAHATAAGSPNTYEAHAAALEAKRARLAEQLKGSEPGVWDQIKQGIEKLGDEVRTLL